MNRLVLRILNHSTERLLSIGLLLLRCLIGIILFIAGAGKLFGWFGGYGTEMTLQFYAKMGFSASWAYLSMYTEFIGGLLLTVGLLTRASAFAVMINMLVATIVSLPGGFLGPTGAQGPFMFLVVDIVILLAGPMAYSLDMLIAGKLAGRN